MTYILTNDDGIDAPGIRAMQQAIDGQGIIVAPKHPHSGCGHQVTTHKGIQVQRRQEGEYAVDGTPADCSRIAITQIIPDTRWVLSGINHEKPLGKTETAPPVSPPVGGTEGGGADEVNAALRLRGHCSSAPRPLSARPERSRRVAEGHWQLRRSAVTTDLSAMKLIAISIFAMNSLAVFIANS